MTVKRLLEHDTEIESLAMANCLMLLKDRDREPGSITEPDRLFHCKTCNKPFRSFQALGGHRASHKRVKLNDFFSESPVKSKTHECTICGQEFVMGQALGGHMRRHRDEAVGKQDQVVVNKGSETKGLCLDLDLGLNLMPYDWKLWPIVS
ncbi:hypothetical protein QVD17_17589 [Tagetes erecta]|uniref:C2H2-type domain-containing protein n=1 Tax=Tagetes erecta TaxID=13708 RepID=A0AAD8P1K0_TARER|nr:hypothetical protein QVD17_17589 [Tagetes erecta]